MNARLSILAAAFAIVAAAACSKEAAPVAVPTGNHEFVAGLEAVTRTTLTEAMKPEWLDTDQVAVFGATKHVFSIKENKGSSAVFTGDIDLAEATTFYAAYPADAAQAVEDGSIRMTLPAVQVVKAGERVAPDALLGGAVLSDPSQVAFKNAVGLLKVTVADERVAAVSVTGNGANDVLAGSILFDASTGSVAANIDKGGVSTVTLVPESGFLAKGDYYLAVAPAELSQGVTMEFVNAAGGSVVKTSENLLSVKRSGGAVLGSISAPFVPEQVITTAAQLREWAAAPALAETVRLGADIDLESVPWTPVFHFSGTFDGQNHKIYNLVVASDTYCGFFGHKTAGVVKDLVFGSKDGETYDGASAIVADVQCGGSPTWHYAAPIAHTDVDKGIEISNVTNFIPVTIAATNDSKIRAGGIVGVLTGTSKMTDCRNFAPITSRQSAGVSNNYCIMGGLIGQLDPADEGKYTEVSGLTNEGELDNTSPVTWRMGGVIGNISGNSQVKADNLVNKATVCHNTQAKKPSGLSSNPSVLVGGVVGGDSSSERSFFSNLRNEGTIRVKKSPSSNSTTYIGGVAALFTNSEVTDCLNLGEIDITGKIGITHRIGGVAAQANKSTLRKCVNKGAMSMPCVGRSGHGGIVGWLHSSGGSVIEECVNDAPVTEIQASNHTQPIWVGGIVGLVDGDDNDSVIRNNINNGAVTAELKTSLTSNAKYMCGAGGIVGYISHLDGVSGNVNNAPVVASNTGGVASEAILYAGGVVGYIPANDSAWNTFGGNVNKGDVTGSVASESKDKCFVGGIVAYNGSVIFEEDKSFCAVSGENAAQTGAGAGVNAKTMTGCTVGGSVNGTALSAANVADLFQGSASTGSHSGTQYGTE